MGPVRSLTRPRRGHRIGQMAEFKGELGDGHFPTSSYYLTHQMSIQLVIPKNSTFPVTKDTSTSTYVNQLM
jgi:hypothetical protein